MVGSPAAARPAPRETLALFVILVGLLRLFVSALAPPLAQEAYYAEYAAHPALSYFDHPPMVAWSIAAGKALFGASTFGLRAGAWALAFGTTWIGLALLRAWGAGLAARRLWVAATVAVPLFAVGLTLAMTEAPLLFFWTAALYSLWRARDGGLGWWALVGLATGGALLSKYTAVFLGVGGVIVLAMDPALRRQILRPGPWLALLLAAACFAPVIQWNRTHEWASFAFQSESHVEREARVDRAATFLAGQFLALTPIVLGALAVAAVAWARRARRDARAYWVLGFGLPLPLVMLVQSPWTYVKLNWLMPAYLSVAFGALVWMDVESAAARYPRAARVGRRLLVVSLGVFLLWPAARWVPWAWNDDWAGWREIAEQTSEVGRALRDEGPPTFYFATSHKIAAHVAHGLRGLREARDPWVPVLGGNVVGEAGLAFDYWTSPADFRGGNAVCVVRPRPGKGRDDVIRKASPHFASFALAREIEVKRLGVVVQRAELWIGRDYLGPAAERRDPSPES